MTKYLSTTSYIFVTAFSFLFIHHVANYIHPMIILLLGSVVGVIFFHVVNLSKIFFIYKQCWQEKTDWLLMMLLILVNWFSVIYGTSLSPPFIYLLFSFASSAALGFLFFKDSENASKKINFYAIFSVFFLILIMILYIVFSALFYIEGFRETLIGSSLGLIGGISGYFYSQRSVIFSLKTGLGASQILASRFWLMLLVVCFFIPQNGLQSLTTENITNCIIIAFVSFIIPLYLYQKGVLDIGAEENSIIRGLTPFVICIGQFFYFKTFFALDLTTSILTAVFIAVPYYIILREKHLSKKAELEKITST